MDPSEQRHHRRPPQARLYGTPNQVRLRFGSQMLTLTEISQNWSTIAASIFAREGERSASSTKEATGDEREFEKREQTGTFFHAGSFLLFDEKRKKKKDRPFCSLPPRTSFHHGLLEGKDSFAPLRHRPGLCYDVGTGTPERKQRGGKKQWRRLRRPTVALEGAEGHFCLRSLRRKRIDPFDVSRDGKRRKKCGL